MIKAVLKYTDCLGDKRVVNYLLAERNVKIIKTRNGLNIYPKVTILVGSTSELNGIVSLINSKTQYGVQVLKVREVIKLFGFYI